MREIREGGYLHRYRGCSAVECKLAGEDRDNCAHSERGEDAEGVDLVGLSAPVRDAWGGRALACDRRGKGRGYLHSYVGCSAFEHELVSEDRDDCAHSEHGEEAGGVDLVGLSAPARDARGGRALACNRWGKGRGYLHSYVGCSAFEHELVGEDHDDCGIGAERADILQVQ
jgi:hypothetical protein